MSNTRGPGNQEQKYEAKMIDGDIVEFSIFSGNETEKITYLKHFVEVNRDQDVFFIDNLTGYSYNRHHILRYKEKES